MGIFDNVENTQAANSGGNYIRPGHYLARVDRIKSGTSQTGAGDFVAVEMTVLEALPDGDVPVNENFEKLGEDQWHRAGEQVSHVLMAKHQSFLGNFKALVANIGGIAEAEVTRERCEAVTDGLFDGLLVEVRARTIKTKSRGTPFTVVTYVREVPAQEVSERVDVETLSRVLGPGAIDDLIAAAEAE